MTKLDAPPSVKEAVKDYLDVCVIIQESLEKMKIFTRGEYDEHDGYTPTKEEWWLFERGRYTASGHMETVILGLKEMVEGLK